MLRKKNKEFIMVGIFGNHPFDRQMERELMRHLDEEEHCECLNIDCDWKGNIDDTVYEELTNNCHCPKCNELIF
jgi:hypothetical protein